MSHHIAYLVYRRGYTRFVFQTEIYNSSYFHSIRNNEYSPYDISNIFMSTQIIEIVESKNQNIWGLHNTVEKMSFSYK